MSPRTTPRDLPWGEIRRQWETSEISVKALARQHGIASKTTVLRRLTDEGWKRDADVVEARQAFADSILDAGAIEGTAEDGAVRTIVAGWKPRGYRPPDPREAASQPKPGALRTAVAVQADGMDAESLVACSLERRRETSFARQMALACVAQDTGLLLLRRVQGVLQPPCGDGDDAADAAALGNLQRLIRINPDRETLAGLVTTGTKAIELGVALERRALAGDGSVKPAPGSEAPASLAPKGGGMELLKRMDVDTALKMRAWAVQIQNERRQAEIDAAKAG
jgi:hypothetical protein